ncbi:hypothetical protein [Bdellovibrio sp. HCB209]|uniref:hypothetical protein n=1 Tax=Bdellovibrio sp. HCB209 TaxID=3394354 RepID=UPI0039B63BA2
MIKSVLNKVFNTNRRENIIEATRNPYQELRDMALNLPHSQRIEPTVAGLYALLCEYKVGETTVTEVYTSEGSASLYFSNGKSIIGGGNHDSVHHPTKDLMSDISGIYQAFPRLKNKEDQPDDSETKFIFVGKNNTHTTSDITQEMFAPNHRLHTLFNRVNNIRTEIRKIEQSRHAEVQI